MSTVEIAIGSPTKKIQDHQSNTSSIAINSRFEQLEIVDSSRIMQLEFSRAKPKSSKTVSRSIVFQIDEDIATYHGLLSEEQQQQAVVSEVASAELAKSAESTKAVQLAESAKLAEPAESTQSTELARATALLSEGAAAQGDKGSKIKRIGKANQAEINVDKTTYALAAPQSTVEKVCTTFKRQYARVLRGGAARQARSSTNTIYRPRSSVVYGYNTYDNLPVMMNVPGARTGKENVPPGYESGSDDAKKPPKRVDTLPKGKDGALSIQPASLSVLCFTAQQHSKPPYYTTDNIQENKQNVALSTVLQSPKRSSYTVSSIGSQSPKRGSKIVPSAVSQSPKHSSTNQNKLNIILSTVSLSSKRSSPSAMSLRLADCLPGAVPATSAASLSDGAKQHVSPKVQPASLAAQDLSLIPTVGIVVADNQHTNPTETTIIKSDESSAQTEANLDTSTTTIQYDDSSVQNEAKLCTSPSIKNIDAGLHDIRQTTLQPESSPEKFSQMASQVNSLISKSQTLSRMFPHGFGYTAPPPGENKIGGSATLPEMSDAKKAVAFTDMADVYAVWGTQYPLFTRLAEIYRSLGEQMRLDDMEQQRAHEAALLKNKRCYCNPCWSARDHFGDASEDDSEDGPEIDSEVDSGAHSGDESWQTLPV